MADPSEVSVNGEAVEWASECEVDVDLADCSNQAVSVGKRRERSSPMVGDDDFDQWIKA